MRLAFLGGTLVLAAGLAGAGAAEPASAPQPRTVLTTRTQILKFAGDGNWIAWTAKKSGCALGLSEFSLRTHRRVVIHGRGDGVSCGRYGGLALAGDRVVWTSLVGAGNTELDVAVATASATAPTARRVRFMALIRPELGAEPLEPPVAARGRTLAYYRHEDGIGGSPAHAVERIAGNRPERIFRFDDPVALAVDRGRIAAVKRGLLRGSACNCNFDPAWSPDGSKLAFVSGQECCVDDSEHADIYTTGSGGSRVQVTNDGRPKLGLAWSPDGTRIVYGYYDSKFASKLAMVNADGTGQHDIATGEYPAWSPDGTKLAFDDGRHIDVVGVDGSGQQQVADGLRPAWSPDGTRLAYSSSGALYSVRLDGTDKHRLADDVSAPAWSPDGATIAGSSSKGIVLVRVDGSGSARLHNSVRGDTDPSWSPDGKRIVFDSLRNDLVADGIARPELYSTDTAGGKIQPLLFSLYDEWNTTLEIRSHYGRLLLSTTLLGEPLAVALDGVYEAALTKSAHASVRRLQILSSTSHSERRIDVPSSANFLSASGGRAVFAAGRTIRSVDLRSGNERLLAFTGGSVVGVTISGRRVTWAENVGKRGRIRNLLLPR